MIKRCAQILTTIAFVAGGANANMITNGSFETPVVAAGGGLSFVSGSTGIPGWTVTGPAGTSVTVLSTTFTQFGFNFPAQSGNQWLDLTGVSVDSTEGIAQTVATIPGTAYNLSFWIGNLAGGIFGTTSTVGIRVNGTSIGTRTNSTPGTTQNWQQFTTTFTAIGSSTTIEFDNLDPTNDTENGLDNVDLEVAPVGAVPEPSSVLFMASGIAILAFAKRKFLRRS